MVLVQPKVARTSENRNPSPQTSSEGDEPWDNNDKQRGAAKSALPSAMRSSRRGRYPTDEVLDDGDLPALNIDGKEASQQQQQPKQMGGRVVGGTRTTTRPLSPPSQAGLVDPTLDRSPGENEKRKTFWKQLDPSEDPRSDHEDMPDDERAARKAYRRRHVDNAPRQDDEDLEYPERDVADPASNLCNYAIAAIHDICTGDTDGSRQPRKTKVLTLRNAVPHDVEEQTAIEVEYVDPNPKPKTSTVKSEESKSDEKGRPTPPDGFTPERKNAYLAAMAKKAKEDFDKTSSTSGNNNKAKKKKSMKISVEATRPAEGIEVEELSTEKADSTTPDNVYSSFNATEKRKFLKLINSGLTPMESTRVVLEERKNATAEVEESDKATEKSDSGKGPRLPFWNRKKQVKGQEDSKEEPDKDVADEDVAKDSTARAALDVEQNKDETSPPEKPTKDDVGNEGSEEVVTKTNESVESKSPSSSDRGDDEDRFAKSGINYYDAVRKHSGDSDDEDAAPQDARPSAVKKKSILPGILSPKNKGFSPLASDAALSTPPRPPPHPPSKSRGSKSSESKRAQEQSIVARPATSPDSKGAQPHEQRGGASQRATEDESDIPMVSSLDRSKPLPDLDALMGVKSAAPQTVSPSTAGSRTPEALSGSPLDISGTVEESTHRAAPGNRAAGTGSPTSYDVAAESSANAEGMRGALEKHLVAPKSASDIGDTETESKGLDRQLASAESKDSELEDHEDKLDVGGLDLDFDAYMESTAMFSPKHDPNHSNDHMSVVSSRSYKTTNTAVTGMSAYTTGTNYTTSTRSRRPGAAKTRLAKAKQAEKSHTTKKYGWQESIEAAAANSNRVWDPQNGWADYSDPTEVVDMDLPPDTRSEERIRISLDRIKTHKTEGEDKVPSSSRGDPVQIPFPPKWEQERSSMFQKHVEPSARVEQAPTQIKQQVPSEAVARGAEVLLMSSSNQLQKDRLTGEPPIQPMEPSPPKRTPRSPPRRTVLKKPTSPSKPRGWVETMRAATAHINNDGKRWDPELGWQGIDDGEEIDIEEEPDTQDFGVGSSIPTTVPNTQSTSPATATAADVESVDASSRYTSATGGPERYIQIGETGSIHSKYQHHERRDARGQQGTTSVVVPPSRDLIIPHRTPQVAGSVETRSSLLVDVVKEKVGEEESGLFPEQPSKKRTSSGRRGSGPVDLDDIEDEVEKEIKYDADNKSFDNTSDFSYENDASNAKRSTPQASQQRQGSKTAIPRLNASKIDTRRKDRASHPTQELSTNPPNSVEESKWSDIDTSFDSASSASNSVPRITIKDASPKGLSGSFDSLSSAGKPIPRLSGPKRDTSPIRGRKASKVATPNRTDSESETPSSVNPSSVEDLNGVVEEDGGTLQSASSARSPSSAVKLRAQQWEARGKEGNQDYHSTRDAPGKTAEEWKSFLQKKVRAETVAAAERRQPQGREAENENEIDRDSLFDFGSNANTNTLQGSEAAHRNRPSQRSPDGLQASDLYRIGMQGVRSPESNRSSDLEELSPIPIQDESDSDVPRSESSYSAGGPVENATFLSRLQACAGPIMQRTGLNGENLPGSHLAFLQNNNRTGQMAKFLPPALCGRPDVIVEEEEDEDDTVDLKDLHLSEEQEKERQLPSRSRSDPTGKGKRGGQNDVSSVISDEFGAKTAYLEAIAMRTAVSGSKKSKRRSTGSSVVSSSSSSRNSERHSEKWQQFLDRKKSGNGRGDDNRSKQSSEDVSKAAEKYAAEKVDEMMEMMASRPPSGGFGDETGAFPTSSRSYAASQAAEDLAAARVEAMMRALSNNNLDEDEGEI